MKAPRKVASHVARAYRYIHHHPEHWIHAGSASATLIHFQDFAYLLHYVHIASALLVAVGFTLYLFHLEA